MNIRSLLLGLLVGSTPVWAQAVKITEAAGWFESAFAKWSHVSGATRYNVYVNGPGLTNVRVDDELIRSYPGHVRVDALGLKPGSYTLKIAPVIGGSEAAATTTSALAVSAHDRTGFAFSGGRIPGGYKTDGTLKDGAMVVYVTEKTKDAVSLTVTGATTNPCVGLQNILFGYKKGKDSRPLVIRMIGTITDLATMDGGDVVIESNNLATGSITLEGVGDDATANGWGIRLKNASNIEIRNLGVMNVNSTAGDNIGLQQNNDHVWIHHIDHFYGDAGSDADQVKGDGAMDVKSASTYVTISYNHFWDNGKCSLLGLNEGTTSGLYITYHHNWFDHSDSRHPRVRSYSAHVYNNYFDGNAKYGIGSTEGSSIFVENNHFRHCKLPMLTSMQGSDVWNEAKKANDPANMGTFSGEDGGTIKAFNNTILEARRFVAYGDATFTASTVDFDAYVVKSRTEKVPASVTSYQGKHVYNNFDTDASVMYAYTPDAPTDVVAKVTKSAGRMNGGDFKWTFDNAVDDTSSAVQTRLKAAIVAYKTSLVDIQSKTGTLAVQTGRHTLAQSPIRFDARTNLLTPQNNAETVAIHLVSPNGATALQSSLTAHGLSLSNLKSGIYFLKATTPQGSFETPLLKN